MRMRSPRLQRHGPFDFRSVDEHAVAALEVFDDDAVPRDGQECVSTRDERIVERQLTARIAPDRELSFAQLEVVLQVAQTEAHGASVRSHLRMPSLKPVARWVNLDTQVGSYRSRHPG